MFVLAQKYFDYCTCVNHLPLIFLQPIPQSSTVPSAITFNWRWCKDVPRGMDVFDQPIAHKEKIYVKGRSQPTAPVTVLEYTPSHDQFSELPPPPVHTFTIATLRGKLLVVGGEDKSTGKITNTILMFDEHCQQWIKSHPAMPIALTLPAVMGYQDHLIVAGGESTNYKRIPNVNILNTASNKWKTAQPLPSVDYSYTVLIQDNIYLVCQNTRTVLKHMCPPSYLGPRLVCGRHFQAV